MQLNNNHTANLAVYEYRANNIMVTYANLTDWLNNREYFAKIDTKPHAFCHRCRANYVAEGDLDCEVITYLNDFTRKNVYGRGWGVKEVRERHDGHQLGYTIALRNDFGDVLDPDWLREQIELHRCRSVSPSCFHASHVRKCHPDNRGVLPIHRAMGYYDHIRKYRHSPLHIIDTSWYRSPKTTNEKRQVAMATIDERAPCVRGARNFRGLANAYDDIHAYHERSWKSRKVKKQWMASFNI